jgi:hypothetical protein
VRYPVAIDDRDATWDAYDNEYWPADYLIDARGAVRHAHFGEGDCAGTEQLIRQLLTAAHPGRSLPRGTDVPNQTPAGELSPETYVGYERLQYLVLGGTGTLQVSVDGRHIQTIEIHGVPRLYTLYQAASATTGKLLLRASPGVQAYDFTFG